ncbi:MAG TPA: hypothetical protein VFN97_15160 [Actinospica sp.]|nr:hypothetical protein [Actinospica sp.]
MNLRVRRAPEPDPYSYGSRHYDLVKEFALALGAVTVLTLILAGVFSSPDEKPVTIATWATADPSDFTSTALAELDGSSGTAGYGPPYNTASTGQKLGPVGLASGAGVTHPIDTAQAFVLTPLEAVPQTPAVQRALTQYVSAGPDQQQKWTGDSSGPVPALLKQLLDQARSGSLDSQLMSEQGFYNTDYTLPLLFLADGSYLATDAQGQHLAGDQWGMMNEVGDYPGQTWLAPYTFWYQIAPYDSSGNGDALVWGTMGVLGALFVLLPFIPGLRSVPRLIPIYRLIWRRHYARQDAR